MMICGFALSLQELVRTMSPITLQLLYGGRDHAEVGAGTARSAPARKTPSCCTVAAPSKSSRMEVRCVPPRISTVPPRARRRAVIASTTRFLVTNPDWSR